MTGEAPTRVFLKLSTEKQQRIIKEAIHEFSRYGFHRASMNRLVERLGIAKGSLFQYFGSKEGLFQFVFDRCVSMAKDALRKIKSGNSGDASFYDKIRATAWAGIKFARENPEVYGLYLRLLFQEDFPLRDSLIRKLHIFSAEYLKHLILEGIERGEISPEIDVSTAVFFLDAVLDRFVQAYFVEFWDAESGIFRAEDEVLQNKIDNLVKIIARGFKGYNSES
ncbi:TetR/AcrR family transcriptional regulator [Thermodesulforhabdus norvegica]|uniref:Transcriptional regulator, TetR family n=1 Tax=Thermodesulforhabdus norvegica TaxID=39841 RepID=A0A1I4UMQ2_9BACT|nr:TetR/AcrR family transcriptional regulator [Thermodesulforhabdus norvegica]SFM90191.1 transcriptional regulator, TetR family [Thermodesulforhabdus norvegica]